MKDVKKITSNIFFFGKLLSIFFILTVSISLIRYKISIYSIFMSSCMVYLTIFISVVIGFLISFNKLFIFFHEIAFSNDLWKLNIDQDYLLMMYPENFFRDIAVLILIFSLSINLFLFFAFKILNK